MTSLVLSFVRASSQTLTFPSGPVPKSPLRVVPRRPALVPGWAPFCLLEGRAHLFLTAAGIKRGGEDDCQRLSQFDVEFVGHLESN